jgi:hypothetical protein
MTAAHTAMITHCAVSGGPGLSAIPFSVIKTLCYRVAGYWQLAADNCLSIRLKHLLGMPQRGVGQLGAAHHASNLAGAFVGIERTY